MMMTNFKWSTILLVHVLLLLMVTEIYASHIPKLPPENIVDEFQEQRNDLVVDKVKKIVYGWRKLSHQERNEFKNQVKGVTAPDNTQTENDVCFKPRPQSYQVYENVEIYAYMSYLYYYPIIEWNLDRTPETDDYWVGIYKVGETDNKKYIIHKYIQNYAQGTFYVGKLSTKPGLRAISRYEQYELRIFKGSYQRVDAVSNRLNGLVHSPYINIKAKQQAGNVDDEPEIEPKLEAFLSAIEVVADDASSEVEEELLSASYYSQEELLQLWSEFNKQEQQLLFPILEQDSLPDEIKKPSKTQSDDRPEPKELYPNLGDNLVLTRASGIAPNEITLTIAIEGSTTSIYAAITTTSAVSGIRPWVGIYKAQSNTTYCPTDHLGSQWVGKGFVKTTYLSDKIIKENKKGPINVQYDGPIFDSRSINGAWQHIAFAANIIQATISATPAAPVPDVKHDFDVGQALTMALLSEIAYKDFDTVVRSVQAYRLTSIYRIYDSGTDTNGYIAINSTTLVVAFRGTNSFRNGLTDGNFLKQKITPNSREFAHSGFVNALNTVYTSVKDRVIKQLGDKKLYVTGHSLGGALASLFAFRISNELRGLDPTLYAYGCPPTGDKDFSDYFQGLLSYIITIQGDPVSTGITTTLGPWVGLYKPREVYYLPKAAGHGIADYIAQLRLQKK